jgi:hypothetical protein
MIAVEPVTVIGSHAFSDLMVARKVWRFVCGTTSNVHVTVPLTGEPGCGAVGSGWIVKVPRQVPARKDCAADGPLGVDPPHPARISRRGIGDVSQSNLVLI